MAPGTWGACAAIVIFGTAIALTGYFAVREIQDDADRAGMAAPELLEPIVEPRPAFRIEPAETMVLPALAGQVDVVQERSSPVDSGSPPAVIAPRPNRRTAMAGSRTGRIAQPSADIGQPNPGGDAEAAPSPAAETGSATPIANAEPAAIEEEPLVPDRWQSMNAALLRCSHENFIAGVLCDQRTRWQYCDGYWGQVSQCRSANRVDGGR